MVALHMMIMQLHLWYLAMSGFYKWRAYAISITNIASKHLTKTNNDQSCTYQFLSQWAKNIFIIRNKWALSLSVYGPE
jgi:hypothetical protein